MSSGWRTNWLTVLERGHAAANRIDKGRTVLGSWLWHAKARSGDFSARDHHDDVCWYRRLPPVTSCGHQRLVAAIN